MNASRELTEAEIKILRDLASELQRQRELAVHGPEPVYTAPGTLKKREDVRALSPVDELLNQIDSACTTHAELTQRLWARLESVTMPIPEGPDCSDKMPMVTPLEERLTRILARTSESNAKLDRLLSEIRL